MSALLTMPPASWISKIPGAISQMFNFSWKNPSNLPEATYARSKAALPEFLFESSTFLYFLPFEANRHSFRFFFF